MGKTYLQPDFFVRCLAHQHYKWSEEQHPEYMVGLQEVSGLYDTVNFVEGEQVAPVPVEDAPDLEGVEVWLANRIGDLITQKDESGEPVVALDLGGGMGGSWLKLAARFKEAINDEKLVLAVSNVARTPADYIKLFKHNHQLSENYGQRRRAVSTAQLLKDHYKKVQYIDIDLSAGLQEYRRPDGEWEDIRGRADIVHEVASVTRWSRIPEIHIPRAAEFVSEMGTYMIRRLDTQEVAGQMMHPLERNVRLTGILTVHASLPDMFGLTRVDRVEAGAQKGKEINYVVFRGPDSLPISAG